MNEFVESLDHQASTTGTVLLTSEFFSDLLVAGDETFLLGLEQLARVHGVRVAWYVRPQHAALEARWRQWGYRGDQEPSSWIRSESTKLHHDKNLEVISRTAPSVALELRPFRRDLLDGGDVVIDFVRQHLGLDAPTDAAEFHANPGLPLDFANLLRGAPTELIEDEPIDMGLRQMKLGDLARHWDIPESSTVRRSRAILQRFAFEQFEAGNQRLLGTFNWPTDRFVEPPVEPRLDSTADLSELDQLWEPDPTAQAYLQAALAELAERSP